MHYSSSWRTWSSALKHAKGLVSNDLPTPLSLVGGEMEGLTGGIYRLLGTTTESLKDVSRYYTQTDGKRIRPMIVLLMSKAIPNSSTQRIEIDKSISPVKVLMDENPEVLGTTGRRSMIMDSQRRLAEITEMIHAASLLHDDVIDDSPTRRSRPSANFKFGAKMSVLAGDYMLGRASVALARLRNPEVVELLATVIANLVEGEFMQLRNTVDEGYDSTMDYYLRKTYLKTASLIAKSCRASAILANANGEVVDAAYEYGKNLGLAFQIVDDMLDYSASAAELGKPSNADLKLGLATAPVLFAWRRHPELGALIKRKFSEPGDVDLAKRLAIDSDGLSETRALASGYCDKALQALHQLPESESRTALEGITHSVLNRTK